MKNAAYGEEKDGTLQFCAFLAAKIAGRCMDAQ